MKKIIYILLVISVILCPCQSFATVGHDAPITTQKVVSNNSQKSKCVTKQFISLSETVTFFFVIAGLSVLSLIIGLILLNWWLIILGAIGIALCLWFVYLLSHITLR
jgi:predicted small secreted protein